MSYKRPKIVLIDGFQSEPAFRRFCGRREFLRRCAPWADGSLRFIRVVRKAPIAVPESSRCTGTGGSLGASNRLFARELLLGGDAGRGERGGLVEGRFRWEPLEHFDEVSFGLDFEGGAAEIQYGRLPFLSSWMRMAATSSLAKAMSSGFSSRIEMPSLN